MRNIYVVTHAESLYHVMNLCDGWSDTPLTEKGHAQAKQIAGFLFSEIGNTGIPVYSSDLKRAYETAAPIADIFGSPVTTDKGLREMNLGEAAGKHRKWLEENRREMTADTNKLDYRIYENAETKRETGTRITESLNEVLRNTAETMVIVTHGLAVTFIIMAWFKIPVAHMAWGQFGSRPATITLLREEETGNRTLVYLCRSV